MTEPSDTDQGAVATAEKPTGGDELIAALSQESERRTEDRGSESPEEKVEQKRARRAGKEERLEQLRAKQEADSSGAPTGEEDGATAGGQEQTTKTDTRVLPPDDGSRDRRSEFNEDLIAVARSQNMDDDAIRALGSNEALRGFLVARGQSGNSEKAGPKEDSLLLPEFTSYTPQTELIDKSGLLDPLDDRLVGMHGDVRSLAEHVDTHVGSLHKVVTGLQETIGKMVESEQAAQKHREAEWYDGAIQQFVQQNPDWADILGAGSFFDTPGEAKEARREVWKELHRSNGVGFSPTQRVARAVHATFNERFQKLQRQQLSKDQDELANQALLPPGRRISQDKLAPHDRALGTIKKFREGKQRAKDTRRAKRTRTTKA